MEARGLSMSLEGQMRKPCAAIQHEKHDKELRGRDSPFQMILEAPTRARSTIRWFKHSRSQASTS